jgi:DNA primase
MEATEIIWGYKGSVDKRLYTAERKRKNAAQVSIPGEELLKVHRKYLESRNFDPDQLIRDWGILGTGPCPDPPYESWKFRLVFPITLNGVVVSFQARDVTGRSDIRYMGATIEQSVYHYKNLLYGQEYCTPELIGLTEGIFDMYRLGKGFVSVFGTSMTSSQLNLIAKHHEKALFLFDPDDPNAGKKAKGYCLSLKSMGISASSVSWDGGDPGSMSVDDAEYMRKHLGFSPRNRIS